MSENCTERAQILLTPTLLEKAKALADARGLSLSALVRSLIAEQGNGRGAQLHGPAV